MGNFDALADSLQLLAETEIEILHTYDFREIKNAEIVADRLFFNIVYEKADPTQDIGWRGYYERIATFEYVKDLVSGEIKQLYSY